jgi:hypothetical protein
VLDGAVTGATSLYSFASKLPWPPERERTQRAGGCLARDTGVWGRLLCWKGVMLWLGVDLEREK